MPPGPCRRALNLYPRPDGSNAADIRIPIGTDPYAEVGTTVVVPLSADGRLSYLAEAVADSSVHVQLDVVGYRTGA